MTNLPNFKRKKLADEKLADNGVEFEYVELDDDGEEIEWGKFKCKHINDFSQKNQATIIRIKKKYAERFKRPISDFEAMNITVCETSLIGWNITDADDKPIPMTAENAMAYFDLEENRRVLVFLYQKAKDWRNYKAVETTKPEKNS